MTRPIVGWILAALALGMLGLAFGETWSPIDATTFGITAVPSGDGVAVARVLPSSAAFRAGVRPGDRIDVMAMSVGDRIRLQTGHSPVGTALDVPVVEAGTTRIVRFVAQMSATPVSLAHAWPFLFNAILTLCVVGAIGLRKPSVATAFLLLYGMGACTTFGIVGLFSWLSGAWFTLVAVFIVTAFSTLPIVALLPFVVRFPEPPTTHNGRSLMHAADAIFAISAVVLTFQVIYEPLIFVSWAVFNYATDLLTLGSVLLFTALVYREETGEARRRIGWVLVGLTISAIGYTGYNYFDTVLLLAGSKPGVAAAASALSDLLQSALPISLAYAVFRHRVLDIGFAVNRTVVFGTMTALVVAVVSLVDWLAGRLISEERLAVVLEAMVTIGFGFALNWLHGRTERLIDRIVFRTRHLAEKRIEYRIGALGFAATSESVDDALAIEAPSIVGLSSAAVFRRISAADPFRRTASTRWGDGTTATLDDDSLLVRTLRSLERTIVLDDVAIHLDDAPSGQARPALAVPIVAQHDVIGFVLFGNREDSALPDPEEISLLERLCSAAGSAYGAVEARQWRERAAALERSLASNTTGAEIAGATPT